MWAKGISVDRHYGQHGQGGLRGPVTELNESTVTFCCSLWI